MVELSKVYQPKEAEEKLYRFWEEQGFFHAEPNPKKPPFCIVIPPPNVTGILHMGHALNNTIQDILIRWKRMQGYETLWMPGTDHAGIATQNVVEKELAKEGKRRQDLGREAFVQRVWEWKEKYGSTIIQQLKRLGASCDWARTRFTMDEGLSQAVQEVFIRLYHKGLIYRGNYIINWCPRCQTALSDEEAVHQEVGGKLYYIRYPIKDRWKVEGGRWKEEQKRQKVVPSTFDHRPSTYIIVATTRPETLLGDVAVAVNAKDKRFKTLKEMTLLLPVLGRELKIIEDDFVDPKFGTGAVKVTPAHDPNDFAMAERHGLEAINVMHPDGRMNENAGPRYSGKDRFACREEIVEQLQQEGLLEKIEPHKHAVGHCYRCHTVVEPRLSLQWFVKMKPLAKPAIRVVKERKLKFYPARWTKVYLNWLENVRDWCISRQIWWGHRIPVWYCSDCGKQASEGGRWKVEGGRKDKTIRSSFDLRPSTFDLLGVNVPFKAGEIPQKCKDCGSTQLVQDEDVLDTWFSSWLWPFSTMDWPAGEVEGGRWKVEGKTKTDKGSSFDFRPSTFDLPSNSLLNYFYPTSTLVTAAEILFFWVARMVMAGFEFMGKEPFRDVYIHGTVRDITGKKMSKSLGNIIDPLDVIEHVGADALRFSLMSMAAQGTDIYLSEQKFEIGRNFGNKIWNAARFILTNLEVEGGRWKVEGRKSKLKTAAKGISFDLRPSTFDLSLPDRWIMSRLQDTIRDVTKAFENYQFNEASRLVYEFFWHDFCDWYIEISKLRIKVPIVQTILVTVLETTLRLLHPMMPFITEEIWQKIMGNGKWEMGNGSIMVAEWPKQDKEKLDQKAEKEMELLKQVIVAVRNLRAELNIPVDKKPRLLVSTHSQNELNAMRPHQEMIQRLASLDEISYDSKGKPTKQVATAVVGQIQLYLFLEGMIDLTVERNRLSKQIEEIEKQLEVSKTHLEDRAFIERAPKEVVEREQAKIEDLKSRQARLKEHLKHLG